MSKPKLNEYIPNYAVSPGAVLQEYLEGYGMSCAELATRAGLDEGTIKQLLAAKAPVTAAIALKLGRVFGRPAHLWSNLERQYQDDLTRLADKKQMAQQLAWLDKFPVNDMVKLGWIPKPPQPKDKHALLEALLSFYGVAAPAQWRQLYASSVPIAYRRATRPARSVEVVSAWLRRGEILAQQLVCAPYNCKAFAAALVRIRALTIATPEVFVPKLQALCAAAGVAFVLVPELPRTGIHGATRWLGDTPVMQLSLYRKSNDQFWFTVMHEAAHILMHGRTAMFIEGQGLTGKQEDEADAYAQDMLIPPARLHEFLSQYRVTLPRIKHFADTIGIAPGIVVGRLQRDQMLPMNIGNKLKVFYRWHEPDLNSGLAETDR